MANKDCEPVLFDLVTEILKSEKDSKVAGLERDQNTETLLEARIKMAVRKGLIFDRYPVREGEPEFEGQHFIHGLVKLARCNPNQG